MSKVISIITPTFNSEKALEKCILSVKNQTYPNIEHVIIDGLSTDGTLKILKKYEGSYNLKWVSEKDSGVADAMDKGFRMATGELFTWIDSDNFYLSNDLIEEVVKAYEGNEGVTMVMTDCYSRHEGSEKNYLISPKNIDFDSLLNKGNTFVPECAFFHRDLFFKAGGFDLQYKLLADYDFWLRVFKEKPRYIKIPFISVIYIANDDSLLRRRPVQAWQEAMKIGNVYGRSLSSRILVRIKYFLFRLKHPILKLIKKNKPLRNFLLKNFR